MMMTTPDFPSFIAGSFVKSFPLYGSIAVGIGSLFVDRESSESRSKVVITFIFNSLI